MSTHLLFGTPIVDLWQGCSSLGFPLHFSFLVPSLPPCSSSSSPRWQAFPTLMGPRHGESTEGVKLRPERWCWMSERKRVRRDEAGGRDPEQALSRVQHKPGGLRYVILSSHREGGEGRDQAAALAFPVSRATRKDGSPDPSPPPTAPFHRCQGINGMMLDKAWPSKGRGRPLKNNTLRKCARCEEDE
ncbi:hypothetical protein IE53DRAFT_114121 [Violaceomyces palustris]|uniref:Uncharacterized protein n=1 Tax=Violaceomyces palustris TaxID=1673888 RepID=A0ACD0NW54_9BASI|nr:hypothetical protein IE53DRAFT_114121 [Violaceomyces palustris]